MCILAHFEKMYYKMIDIEERECMKGFINSIEFYSEKMDNGSIVKQINLKFSVYKKKENNQAVYYFAKKFGFERLRMKRRNFI